jgi:hypothetical protein
MKTVDICNALMTYNKEMNTSYGQLKDCQEEAICAIRGRDVLCILPTGYGKSLIFELLPFVERPLFSELRERTCNLPKTIVYCKMQSWCGIGYDEWLLKYSHALLVISYTGFRFDRWHK